MTDGNNVLLLFIPYSEHAHPGWRKSESAYFLSVEVLLCHFRNEGTYLLEVCYLNFLLR